MWNTKPQLEISVNIEFHDKPQHYIYSIINNMMGSVYGSVEFRYFRLTLSIWMCIIEVL